MLDPWTPQLLENGRLTRTNLIRVEAENPRMSPAAANCGALDGLIRHSLCADDPLKLLATIRASLIAIPLCNYTVSCDK